MTLAQFHNALRILLNLDRADLVEAGIIDRADHNAWGEFRRDPFRRFIKAPDPVAAKLWALMQKRMKP